MKDLAYLKNFDKFYLNEDTKDGGKDDPKKVKVYSKSTTAEAIKKLSPEAFDYLQQVITLLNTDDDFKEMKAIKLVLIKKAQLGLTEEKANELNTTFQNDDTLKFGENEFNSVFIEKKAFTEIIEENVKLKAMYAELNKALGEWNTANASIFNFDNNVSDKVSNAEESNKALETLKGILEKYKEIVKNVNVNLVGHTSTTGTPEGNKKLSDGRAATVKNMLLALYPEAKDYSITAIGKGQDEPIHPDDKNDKEKQKKNRRVEIKIDVKSDVESKSDTLTKYNVVIYGFQLFELEDAKQPEKTKTARVPKHKKAKLLNPKKGIPCPKFGR